MSYFTDERLERYSRHIILKEIGVKGQERLYNSKVLIIGAGGLGAPAAQTQPIRCIACVPPITASVTMRRSKVANWPRWARARASR